VRLARGFTKRDKIIKFEGCYHGHADYFLIKAGSGALTFGVPTSPGVTNGNAKDTLIADYNDINSVKKIIEQNKNEIAAIILEPVAGNMGVVPAEKSFLEELRQICDDEKIVLIFDEVMTGFRLAKGGAQELYGIKPDLVAFGKIIGGGLPVGAYGGKLEIMSLVAPSGPVYQAGTLSGNPLAMSAGYAALNYIKNNQRIYEELEKKSKFLVDGFRKNLNDFGKSYTINQVGSMVTLFFTEKPVKTYRDAIESDTKLFSRYFHGMLKRGIYLPPSQFEAFFISTAHTQDDLQKTVDIQREVFEELFS
ncbi:MAG: glutamate-1-semialdehyde 2,1-aminomutase, partial [Proteobacteria bacterium]|nr:glutamate-1-semialdehyde 2,1-aminomutase [Pseudomonadota bacterium]